MKSADPRDLDGFYHKCYKKLEKLLKSPHQAFEKPCGVQGDWQWPFDPWSLSFPTWAVLLLLLHAHAWPFFHTLSTYWCVHLKWEYSTRHECSLQCSSVFTCFYKTSHIKTTINTINISTHHNVWQYNTVFKNQIQLIFKYLNVARVHY